MKRKGIKVCCDTCEFNFEVVCASHGLDEYGNDIYGSSIEQVKEMFPHGCDDWRPSFEIFCRYLDGK